MHLIDTHTHIYGEEFDQDRSEMIQRSIEAGVKTLILPAIDPESFDRQEALWEAYQSPTENPEIHIHQMMGLHPTSVKENYQQWLFQTEQLLMQHPEKYCAVGEIGLDYYWDRTFENEQQEVLKIQMQWAQQLDKPVALHVRNAYQEMFALLRGLQYTTYKGVMHCFGGTPEEALTAVEMGFHIGIGGVVTFKKAEMAKVVETIPLEHLLLETDAPYLAPVPYRGKRNESAYVLEVAKKIAEIKQVSLEEVAIVTTHNANQLFGLETALPQSQEEGMNNHQRPL